MQDISTPNFFSFNPTLIPWQYKVIYDIEQEYDFSKGPHKILLSGSLASAKSTLMAWLAIRHATKHNGARILLARRSLPDLKGSIYQKIIEMLDGAFVDGKDYRAYDPTARITFQNGSEIFSKTWADKRYKKFRSLDLSMICLEELTENELNDYQAYKEMVIRLGRLKHIKESYFISATNPGDPDSWQYKEFIGSTHPNTHVYYSLTEQNPFLPEGYIEHVKRTSSEKECERLLYGKWISLTDELLYYAYDKTIHYREERYKIDEKLPIDIAFDFNIGHGRPMSCVIGQITNGKTFNAIKTFIVHGFNTERIMQEIKDSGFLDYKVLYRIFGDAAGKHKDTRSTRSDYDIIESFFKGKNYQMRVPISNPPIRRRQNVVNATLKNGLGEVNTIIWQDAEKLGDGLKSVRPFKGSSYQEDDSNELQHVVSAWGYYLTNMQLELNIKDTKGNF